MTDTELLDFCEQNDIEITFRFEKETHGYYLKIRREYWQYSCVITSCQIERSKALGSTIKAALTNMVNELNRAERARKPELEEHHDPD